MYRKIVLAYDGSSVCASARQRALTVAKLSGAELHVLGIAVPSGGMVMAESIGSEDLWGREKAEFERVVNAAAKEISQLHPATVASVRNGDPATEIAAYVTEVHADLLVLGHSNKNLMARWLEGSVGARLLSRLPCDLLIASSATAGA